MKNNNFPQPQNIPNFSLNKNPSRIQNFNYMFYLPRENPNFYNFQNLANPLLPLAFIPNFPQVQFQTIQDIPLFLPLFNNNIYNNILQLSLLNAGRSLSQNQNMLPNNNNINEPQNTFQNNFLLNRKTLNPNYQEINNVMPNKIKKTDNNDNYCNNPTEEENNIFPKKKEDETSIKSDLKNEINSEEKNLGEIEEENLSKENNIIEEKNEENNEEIEKNDITTSIKEGIKEEDKNENKETTKKKKKKRNNYKELLYDPILEHIGKEEKNDKDKSKNMELEENSSVNENEKNKEENINNKTSSVNNNKKGKQKPRTKNGRHSRKKQHKITLKNNKDILADLEENKNGEENNSKYTKIIFHGKDYQQTKNVNDFMKYNFDFIVDEQYTNKKVITDYTQQHVNIKSLNDNTNIYDNYNYSEQHLDDIKNMWSREKFNGDNEELRQAVNKIRDNFNERKLYSNEEKYLNIIKNNNYSIDGLENKKN